MATCKRGCKFYSKNSAKPRKRRGEITASSLSSFKKKKKTLRTRKTNFNIKIKFLIIKKNNHL
jgi:hypothetical protein